jgi:hypothetical protein
MIPSPDSPARESLAMAAHPPITVVIISPPRPIVNFQ